MTVLSALLGLGGVGLLAVIMQTWRLRRMKRDRDRFALRAAQLSGQVDRLTAELRSALLAAADLDRRATSAITDADVVIAQCRADLLATEDTPAARLRVLDRIAARLGGK